MKLKKKLNLKNYYYIYIYIKIIANQLIIVFYPKFFILFEIIIKLY